MLSVRMQVETELLQEYETQLLEKEHSGCAALLQDDKVCPMPPILARVHVCPIIDASCSSSMSRGWRMSTWLGGSAAGRWIYQHLPGACCPSVQPDVWSRAYLM